MADTNHKDELPPDEADRRRDELARRILRTPPEPRKPTPAKKPRATKKPGK